MANRTMRTFLLHLLAPAIALAAAAQSAAQTQPLLKKEESQPALPSVAEAPKTPVGVVHAEADRRLQLAFPESGVLQMPFRLWLADAKIALAASDLQALPDNRLQAQNLSMAFFGDRQDAVKTLSTMPAAVLKLDRAIAAPGLLASCKILAIEAIPPQPSSLAPPPPPPPSTLPPANPSNPATAVGKKVVIDENLAVQQAIQQLKIDPALAAELRFKFKIDPKTPLSDLVPAPGKAPVKLPDWTNEDLSKVPELAFGEPVAKTLSKDQALEATAHILAKINHVNQQKTDGFMLALLDKRADLRGLPVLMGDACRTREEPAAAFAAVADAIRQNLQQAKNGTRVPLEAVDQFFSKFGEINLIGIVPASKLGVNRANVDHVQRATVAALMQILMPESENFRTGLAKYLATIPQVDATKALAELALFAPEDEVRAAAIEGLKTRRERDYTDMLLQGFRYPLPAVSKRAAEALVKLDRQDLLANLVAVLERPDPRLPVTAKQDGKDVTLVRELVRVNHHRNCVLCHAPGNTETTPTAALTVAVPLPTEPLPRPSDGGYQSTPPASPDIVVRIDMTYLRQDFSLMMPVADPHPWPEMQRFDFLVRTRELTAGEAQAYEPCCAIEEPTRLSPYHRAALFALRELTGRDTEPTAAAWRKLLKLPAQ